MPETPIYPRTTLEGYEPADLTLAIENWMDHTMTDLIVQWGSGRSPQAEDARDQLEEGETWWIPLADHGRVLAHYYQKRKAYDRDIPYELSWTDHEGVRRSLQHKAYLMDELGEGPVAPTNPDDELNPVSKSIAFVIAASVSIWLLWCTVVAFTGGTLPLLGWKVDGGFVFGLVWVFLIDPIAMALGYWAGMVIALPLVAVSEKAGRGLGRT